SSINTNILENLASFFTGNIDYPIYDKIGEFPHFNPDLDNEKGPKGIEEFGQELNEADALIFCTPEYARRRRKSSGVFSTNIRNAEC
ncbi:NADPH-dependent FMN reductase, partial [Priestia filamentosa]|uniref:NADPH-dependent FMN reductase n=1 Tax=Priestia filamentosa TaxID=1402861 RepID=UPI00397AD514